MGYFPGVQRAKPARTKPSSGGGGGGSSAPTALKTSPALTKEENERRMSINRARGVGDSSGHSSSDPRYGTAQAPSSQFKSSGPSAQIEITEKPALTKTELISSLARRQEVLGSAKGYYQTTAAKVAGSPERRIEKEELQKATTLREFNVGGGRIKRGGLISVFPGTPTAEGKSEIGVTQFLERVTPTEPTGKAFNITQSPEIMPVTRPGSLQRGATTGVRVVTESLVMPLEFGGKTSGKGLSYAGGKSEVLESKLDISLKERYGPRLKPSKLLKPSGEFLTGVGEGFRLEAREKPIQTALLFTISAAIPPAAAGGKLFLARYGLPAIPKAVGSVVKYGLVGTFVGFKAAELKQTKSVREVGRVLGRTGTQVGAIALGTQVGIKVATPIELRAGLEREISTLPKDKQTEVRALLKEARSVKTSKVKELNLRGFERIPTKARPVIKQFLRERNDLVVFGSAAQRAQLNIKRSYAESDIDVAVFGSKNANTKAAANLAARLRGAGLERVSTVKGKVTIEGIKIVEFKPFSKLEASSRQVINPLRPISSEIVRTPSGINLRRVSTEIGRKVVGGYLPGQRPTKAQRLKDVKDLNKLLLAARMRTEREAAGSLFFQKERLKDIKIFTGRKAQFKVSDDDIELVPFRALEIERDIKPPRMRVYDSYFKTTTVKPSSFIIPSGKSSVFPVGSFKPSRVSFFSIPQKVTSVTTSFLPKSMPEYKTSPLPRSSPPSPLPTPPSPLPSPVSPLPSPPVVTPPSILPTQPRGASSQFVSSFLSESAPPRTPPLRLPRLRFGGDERKEVNRVIRPFRFQASLKAVAFGIKAKRKRRPDDFLSGFEIRPIPIT